MTDNDVNMGTPTPHDKATDGLSGSADTTVDQDDDIGPNLDPFLDGLAGDEGGKEAKSLREWITEDKFTGQGLEMKDSFGRTPLHVAATRGLSAAATKFIRDGATLNAQDRDGETPLYAACYNGHEDIVKLLLGAGADTTISNQIQRTPLYVAADLGFKSIVQLLCENPGKDLDMQERWLEWTPIHTAAYDGRKTIVRYLKDAGARLDLQDQDGWTPLMTAVVKEQEDVLKILLEGLEDGDKSLDIEDSAGRTPLMRAAEDGFLDGARLLIMAGAKCDKSKDSKATDTNSTLITPRQDSALHLAVSANQLEMVRLLLVKGANVNALNDEGKHSSHLASSKGNEAILKLLLDTKDSKGLDARDDDGMTPLHRAVLANQLQMVQFLVQKGVDMNARSAKGQHSSHLASLQGNEAILKLILDTKDSNGLDARDINGMTPLHLASNTDKSNDDDQEALDMATNGHNDDETLISEPGQYNKVARLLLQRHADTTAVTNDNKTALELAFDSGHHEGWKTILNSLQESSDEFSRALLRAASRTQRHPIAISLLQIQVKQSGTPLPSESKSWTAIEWAAYAVNPDALWLSIASSPRKMETVDAISHAKARVATGNQLAEHTANAGVRKRGEADDMKKSSNIKKQDNVKKQDNSANKLKRIREYLDDSLIGLLCSDSQKYRTSIFEEQHSLILDEYKAAIVQFHKQGGRFGRIIRSRTVKETIYTEGPKRMMEDVVSMLEKLAKEEFDHSSAATNFMGAKSQFTWIHLPATNITWMDDILQRIMKDEDRPANEYNQVRSFFKDSWIQVPDNSSPSRIMRPRFVWRNINENETQSKDPSTKRPLVQNPDDSQSKDGTLSRAAAAPSPIATAIYLSDECYNGKKAEKAGKLSKSNEKLDTRSTKVIEPMLGKPLTTMRKTAELDAEELKFAEELSEKRVNYEHWLEAYKEKIVHGSSTLDESYYHFGDDKGSRQDKEMRNRSQVVTESWRDKFRDSWRNKQEHGLYWPLIRVNQLWIWTINDKWLISASSHPIDASENELLPGILDLLDKQGDVGGSGLQPSSASEMSQFIVDYCIESYERKPKGTREDGPEDCRLEKLLSIRQTFSKSINSIARDETNLFERFSVLTKELRERSPHMTEIEDAQGRSLDNQLQNATLDAETLSGKVKDILDELNSLEATVNYQQDVQRSMKVMKALKSMKKQALQMGMKEMKKDNVPETDLSATYIIKDINRLDNVAKRVHEAVNTTLSLQQSEIANLQARFSLEQAKFSIQQAEDSAKQGRVLMVFTVVTIVFLPLSFLTSFFALDVSSFQVPPWIVGVIFSVSIAFVVPTVILAFIPPRSILRFTVNLPRSIATETIRFICYMLELFESAKEMRTGKSRSNPDRSNPDPEKGLVQNGGSTQALTKLQPGA